MTLGLSIGTEGHNTLRDEFWKQELVKEHTRYNNRNKSDITQPGLRRRSSHSPL